VRDRRLLEPHELPILALGVLCGVVIAVGAVWFLLRTGIVDELDPLGVPIVIGVLIGSVTGVVLVAAARRARL
jgi:hypothetical protein